jgi:hypothetical protein
MSSDLMDALEDFLNHNWFPPTIGGLTPISGKAGSAVRELFPEEFQNRLEALTEEI